MQHLDAHILLATASPRTGANTAVPLAPMQKGIAELACQCQHPACEGESLKP